jgi:hypothetical protein
MASVSNNIPKKSHHAWDVLKDYVGRSKDDSWSHRLLTGISETGQRLRHISKDPIISVTSLDVLFTIISLLTWTFTRDLDVEAILENSILAVFVPKHEKHVAFEDDAKRLADLHPEPEPILDTTTPRKRGRPAKNKTTVNGASISSAISHTARDVNHTSDTDTTYQPSSTTKREIAETEADGTTSAADLVHSGESTALALFLAFAGGLGQLAASALGAEVTGPRE